MGQKDNLDHRMRELESYRELRVPPECWLVLRLDGRGFSRFTESAFDKPFDERFSACMEETVRVLLTELPARLAYSQSDEISLLFSPDFALFQRRLEKLVSVSASLAGSAFFRVAPPGAGHIVAFDSRVWLGPTLTHVQDYLDWRQRDGYRCSLNAMAYWLLRRLALESGVYQGLSAGEITRLLTGKKSSWKHELLFSHGLNFNDTPLWQRRGFLVGWEQVEKVGFNPLLQQEEQASRRQLAVNRELPHGPAFRSLVLTHLRGTAVDSSPELPQER